MQGIFRNPLADPGIIGVSAGGALGAVIAIHFGFRSLHYLATPALAFLGALGAVMLVYVLAATRGVDPLTTMILAGVAVQAFIGSVISAVLTLTGQCQLHARDHILAHGQSRRPQLDPCTAHLAVHRGWELCSCSSLRAT